MKKFFMMLGLFASITILCSSPIHAWDHNGLENLIPLHLSVSDIKPVKDRPRTPDTPPQISLTNHTLYFHDGVELTVNIYSEDGDEYIVLEYTAIVLNSTSSISLPSVLQGPLYIEVIRGEQHYWGEFEL